MILESLLRTYKSIFGLIIFYMSRIYFLATFLLPFLENFRLRRNLGSICCLFVCVCNDVNIIIESEPMCVSVWCYEKNKTTAERVSSTKSRKCKLEQNEKFIAQPKRLVYLRPSWRRPCKNGPS